MPDQMKMADIILILAAVYAAGMGIPLLVASIFSRQ